MSGAGQATANGMVWTGSTQEMSQVLEPVNKVPSADGDKYFH